MHALVAVDWHIVWERLFHPDHIFFRALYTTVYIASDGSVRSGCYVLPPMGNVLEQDIGDILASPVYRERCQAMLRLECPGCACNVFTSLRKLSLLCVCGVWKG